MYVERDIEDHFNLISKKKKTIALVGPRQAGKTTLLKNRITDGISFLLFDDPDIRDQFQEDIKLFQHKYLQGNEITIMDEIQVCKGAGSKLKYLVDTGNTIWMTSSSEALLGKEVLSFLVGRVSILRLFPFSLIEVIKSKKVPPTTTPELKRTIMELASFGGYPDVVLDQDPRSKTITLKNLYETMVLKDVSKVFNLNDIGALERTILYLSNNYTGLLNTDNMTRSLSISYKTLMSYLNAIEKSYIVKIVRPYFTNPNKELIKQPKIYFIDNGLRNVISGNMNLDIDGASFENLVFTELLKMGYEPKYWRKKTGSEVDFIVQFGNEMIPIEVKINTHGNKIESGLRSFIRLYSPSKAYVVCFDGEPEKKKINGTEIIFLDLLKLREDLSR
jgi:hypothetical protein